MKKTSFYIFILCLFSACSLKKDKQIELLKSCIRENVHTQTVLNQSRQNALKTSWRYAGQGETAIAHLHDLRTKIMSNDTLSTKDFILDSLQIEAQKFRQKLYVPLDTLPDLKSNLSIPEKIRLYTIANELVWRITEPSCGCGWQFFALHGQAYNLPVNGNRLNALITISDSVETERNSVTFYFDNNSVETFYRQNQSTDKNTINFVVPRKPKVIAIEWNDSLHGQSRKFTWPNYNNHE